MKGDSYAREVWFGIYDDMPKSAYATLAYYLAERLAGGECEPLDMVRDELNALRINGLVEKRQIPLALRK